MTLLSILTTLAAFLLVGMALKMKSVLRALPRLSSEPPSIPDDIQISVIIPAYNEETLIASTVRAVLDSTPSNRLEVIVVDDWSTDGTLEQVKKIMDPRLALLAGAPRPANETYFGKNWACWQGAQAASGDYLLFVDADFTMKPGCIESALHLLRNQNAALLGLMPEKEITAWFEWFIEPQLTILHLVSPWVAETENPQKPLAFTPGWFMLFDRTVYEKIGGHRGVRKMVLEDLALGEAVKAANGKVVFALAPQHARLHLYDSWSELYEGYTKNFFCGANHCISTALTSLVLMLLIYSLPWLGLLTGLINWSVPGWQPRLLIFIGLAGLLAQFHLRCQIRSALGIGLRAFWAIPVSGLLLAFINFQSMIRHFRKKSTWKGISVSEN